MTSVLETNAAPSIPAVVSAMQDILLTHIQESKTKFVIGADILRTK